MPRGEDTSRHEGRKVHRDTPRIASLLAEHLNQNVVYPVQEQIDNMREQTNLVGMDSFANDSLVDIADNLPDYVKEYTPESAQTVLNEYRDMRDRSTRRQGGHFNTVLEDYQSDLGAIIRNR